MKLLFLCDMFVKAKMASCPYFYYLYYFKRNQCFLFIHHGNQQLQHVMKLYICIAVRLVDIVKLAG